MAEICEHSQKLVTRLSVAAIQKFLDQNHFLDTVIRMNKKTETPAKPLNAQEIEKFLDAYGKRGHKVELQFYRSAKSIVPDEKYGAQHLVGLVTNRELAEMIRSEIDRRYRDPEKRAVFETGIVLRDLQK